MRCTNRTMRTNRTKRAARSGAVCLALSILLQCAGCGQEAVTAGDAFDLYGTACAVGISVTSEADRPHYFSEGLCVADNTDFGTEYTSAELAEGAGLFHLASNTVLYARNIYGRLYPASTTKILTAYIALKYCDNLDDTAVVSENAADQAADSSKCELKAGDVIKIRDLLYGMLLRSGNDAAIVIAEHISGSVEAFAELMNQEARLLGATQSHFVNPNGLPDPDHYTSVYDLYLFLRAAVQSETFVNIIGAESYEASYLDAAGTAVEKTWENTNQYMTGQTEPPDGVTVLGGKTGTTGDAGYCLALYALNPAGEPVISIVLKAEVRADLYQLMNEMLQKA